MKQAHPRRDGFTLIELLTVIAIIGILAGLVAAVLPRALERAKVGRVQSTMTQIRTALVEYLTDHGGYPPAYGYLIDSAFGLDPASLTAAHFVYVPYMARLGFHRNVDLYDNFSESGDTTRDGQISLLEFSPVGMQTGASAYTFTPEIYNGTNLPNEVNQQLNSPRPLVYIPVNRRQVGRYADYLYGINPADPRPRPGDASNPANPLLTMQFPPPAGYDAAVLISIGPDGHTRGLLEPVGVGMLHPSYTYHVLGIMAYFMATRDANGNGQLDFDFLARTRGGEARVTDAAGNLVNTLPDPQAPNAAGPIIFKVD